MARLCACVLVLALASGATWAHDNISIADLKVRAAAGDKTATRQLADAYYLGRGVEQDFKQAAE
jgi:TPR repeat protein